MSDADARALPVAHADADDEKLALDEAHCVGVVEGV